MLKNGHFCCDCCKRAFPIINLTIHFAKTICRECLRNMDNEDITNMYSNEQEFLKRLTKLERNEKFERNSK